MSVACNKLPPRFGGRPEDRKWPVIPGFKNINVCSGSPGIWKFLSPMKLGPIMFVEKMPDGSEVKRTATNLENLWQASKVFPGEEDAKTGVPNHMWWTRRAKYWADTKAHRHVEGKNGIKPLYSFWNGRKLDYDTARKTIYIPLYTEYVQATGVWHHLQRLVHEEKQSVQLLGYDGRPYDRTSATGLFQELEDLSKPFGHELVLCAMLEKKPVWLWKRDPQTGNVQM